MKVIEFKVKRLFMKYMRVLLKIIFVRLNVRIYTRNPIITHLGLMHLQKNVRRLSPYD